MCLNVRSEMLLLIDDVQRLGLQHRFEKDIRTALDRYVSLGGCIANKDGILFTTSLGFRLIRQHGFDVSQGSSGRRLGGALKPTGQANGTLLLDGGDGLRPSVQRLPERWDVNAVSNLPHYMKLCFLALINTVHEMAYEALKEHGENIIPYLKKAWADLCKTFLQEAKWTHNKITPMFAEYLDNGWVSESGVLILIHAYFLCSPNITYEALGSLEKFHDLLKQLLTARIPHYTYQNGD
ncbi:hypothetical protein CRG98_033197 [Punica granatum]|uniref:Terpene synthase N-terminal domain-containing protein n=1 Tax=Punica granatum TaxID=22663 RepID=A0A2I0IQZ7_PUNGR|nr:hypothetical protein CRG98_033197 [Punica granatum]